MKATSSSNLKDLRNRFGYRCERIGIEHIPLLAEQGWLRHQLKVAQSPKAPQTGAERASAIARSHNSGQLGEIFRPEQFRRTDHPGRAVSERIHFYLWRVHPSSARRGIVCATSIRSHVHRPPLQLASLKSTKARPKTLNNLRDFHNMRFNVGRGG